MKIEEAIRLLVLEGQHEYKSIDLKAEYEYYLEQDNPLFIEWLKNEAKSIRMKKIEKINKLYEN